MKPPDPRAVPRKTRPSAVHASHMGPTSSNPSVFHGFEAFPRSLEPRS
jgi:hypothetical protein